MTRRALATLSTLLFLTAPAAADVFSWKPVETAPPPAAVKNLLPQGALLVVGRGGERLRFRAASRPIVGRLWQNGTAFAYLAESDRLMAEAGGGAWELAVPLGSQAAIVVVPAKGAKVAVERAEDRDPGYAWEVYEDALTAWAAKDEVVPPEPPSAAARGAWIETRAAAALLGDGAADARAAIALDGVARSRPLAEPFYRHDATPLRAVLLAGTKTVKVIGPAYLEITARGPAEEGLATVRMTLAGRPVAGGKIAGGPPIAAVVKDHDAGPATRWVVRVPEGTHRLAIGVSGGRAWVGAEAWRKRVHVSDALSGAESIEARAAKARASKNAIVRAEGLRLAGDPGAEKAFRALAGDKESTDTRAYAAWRLGELAADAAASDRWFELAAKTATGKPAELAIARARVLRAVHEDRAATAAAVIAAHPDLWSDGELAAALVGPEDDGRGIARLAAAAARTPVTAAAALRRAWFDRTVWSGAPLALGHDPIAVLAKDAAACADGPPLDPDSIYPITEKPVELDVPADPMGSNRFRTVRVLAIAPKGTALDAAVKDGDTVLATPTISSVEMHKLALAPGKHQLTASGGAELYVAPPADELGAARPRTCSAWRRRSFAPIDFEGLSLPVPAPGGDVVGLELRLLSPGTGVIAQATVEVDGTRRQLRYLAMRDGAALVADSTKSVAESIIVDFTARDARTLRVTRTDHGDGTLLGRPLVRTASRRLTAAPASLADVETAIAKAEETATTGDAPVEALRKLTIALAAARTPAEQSKLRLARALLLTRLARWSYAEEDLRAGLALGVDAGVFQALLDEERRYVDPMEGAAGYPIDPAAAILRASAKDPTTRAFADQVRKGDLEPVRRFAARKGQTAGDTGAIALVARTSDAAQDPLSASQAYGALARRFPEDARLRVAEADRRLDAEEKPVRAFVAAVLAGATPGASDARARASDATRWRRIQHAQASAGVIHANELRNVDVNVNVDVNGRAIRQTLAAPETPAKEALWLEQGQLARAVILTRKPTPTRVEATCTELRPVAAAQRVTEAPCRLTVRLDGHEQEGPDLGVLARGDHTVEVALAPGGVDTLAAVRIRSGEQAVVPTLATQYWLAAADEPVVLDVLGPTVLRIDAAPDAAETGSLAIAEPGHAEPLGVVDFSRPAAGPTVVALPQERRYHLELRPNAGRAAVSADLREDLHRQAPRLVAQTAPTFAPTSDPPLEPPIAPVLITRAAEGNDTIGTITLSTGVRDGALGERDTATERGGRYGEVDLAYRRRTGSVWWRADGFGRMRLQGDPSGGLGGRAYWKVGGPFRLEGGALAVMQDSPNGTLVTGWLDAAASARLELGASDWFLTPGAGGLLRVGPTDDPMSDAIDPDVWSTFDVAHDKAVVGQLKLSYEPWLDLHFYGRTRATTNADVASLDRAATRVGAEGAIGRLYLDGSAEIEHRFADADRMEARTRPIFRLDLSFGLWRSGPDRFSVVGAGALRPGERSDVFVGLAYDWTFGRGMTDYAPDESVFSHQLGPYGDR